MGERPPLAAFSRRPRVCSVVVLSGRGWPLLTVKAHCSFFSQGALRGLALGGWPVAGSPCPRMLRITLEGTLLVPQTPRPRCTQLSVAGACRGRDRPALSEEVAFSSYPWRKGCALRSRGGSLPDGPLEWHARDCLLREAFALSSTAARASPLRVRGGITRGRACRPAVCAGALGALVVAVGEGPCACPRARHLSTHPE